jgi:hypothetical protein
VAFLFSCQGCCLFHNVVVAKRTCWSAQQGALKTDAMIAIICQLLLFGDILVIVGAYDDDDLAEEKVSL